MMRFEWDENKDELNRLNHGINFATAQLVFNDAFHVSFIANIVDGEERWQAIGSVEGVIVLVVVHTYRSKWPTKSFVSSQLVVQRLTKGNCMSKLSDKERGRLKAIAARPDDEIDISDIPEVREIPPEAVIGRFYRPQKKSVTIRLDADVLAWLKASGEGYQTRINGYLREIMRRSRQTS